jgi:hypothetical protein
LLYFSIAAVRSDGLTILPGHHHLVQGLVSLVISGQDNCEMVCWLINDGEINKTIRNSFLIMVWF